MAKSFFENLLCDLKYFKSNYVSVSETENLSYCVDFVIDSLVHLICFENALNECFKNKYVKENKKE